MSIITTLDIETAPNVAYVWGLWKQNVGINQIHEQSYIMSIAAKNLGSDKVEYFENRGDNELELLTECVRILDEADFVVGHNCRRFDLKRIHAHAATLGLPPPSPYKVIDTLDAAKKYFMFPSNKLEYLADVFGVAPKGQHGKFAGFKLWLECLRKNPEAWEEMKKYNIQDVITNEQLYLKMRPWIADHPNVAVFEEDDGHVCPKCGGKHLQKRGFYRTNVGKYQRYRCNSCGGWSRTRHTEYDKGKRAKLLTNAI